jgi:hypothetical protein
MWKGAVVSCFKIISRHLPGRTEENDKSHQSVFGSMFETRTSRTGSRCADHKVATLGITLWFILDVWWFSKEQWFIHYAKLMLDVVWDIFYIVRACTTFQEVSDCVSRCTVFLIFSCIRSAGIKQRSKNSIQSLKAESWCRMENAKDKYVHTR